MDGSCPECGRSFECRPGEDCWCEDVPAVLPVPEEGARCLCPRCLEKLLRERAKRP